MNNRLKNPYFWFGLIGVIATAAGISLESLTSWDILYQNILTVLSNPFLVVSVLIAITGVFVDPTTKGLKDEVQDKE